MEPSDTARHHGWAGAAGAALGRPPGAAARGLPVAAPSPTDRSGGVFGPDRERRSPAYLPSPAASSLERGERRSPHWPYSLLPSPAASGPYVPGDHSGAGASTPGGAAAGMAHVMLPQPQGRRSSAGTASMSQHGGSGALHPQAAVAAAQPPLPPQSGVRTSPAQSQYGGTVGLPAGAHVGHMGQQAGGPVSAGQAAAMPHIGHMLARKASGRSLRGAVSLGAAGLPHIHHVGGGGGSGEDGSPGGPSGGGSGGGGRISASGYAGGRPEPMPRTTLAQYQRAIQSHNGGVPGAGGGGGGGGPGVGSAGHGGHGAAAGGPHAGGGCGAGAGSGQDGRNSGKGSSGRCLDPNDPHVTHIRPVTQLGLMVDSPLRPPPGVPSTGSSKRLGAAPGGGSTISRTSDPGGSGRMPALLPSHPVLRMPAAGGGAAAAAAAALGAAAAAAAAANATAAHPAVARLQLSAASGGSNPLSRTGSAGSAGGASAASAATRVSSSLQPGSQGVKTPAYSILGGAVAAGMGGGGAGTMGTTGGLGSLGGLSVAGAGAAHGHGQYSPLATSSVLNSRTASAISGAPLASTRGPSLLRQGSGIARGPGVMSGGGSVGGSASLPLPTQLSSGGGMGNGIASAAPSGAVTGVGTLAGLSGVLATTGSAAAGAVGGGALGGASTRPLSSERGSTGSNFQRGSHAGHPGGGGGGSGSLAKLMLLGCAGPSSAAAHGSSTPGVGVGGMGRCAEDADGARTMSAASRIGVDGGGGGGSSDVDEARSSGRGGRAGGWFAACLGCLKPNARTTTADSSEVGQPRRKSRSLSHRLSHALSDTFMIRSSTRLGALLHSSASSRNASQSPLARAGGGAAAAAVTVAGSSAGAAAGGGGGASALGRSSRGGSSRKLMLALQPQKPILKNSSGAGAHRGPGALQGQGVLHGGVVTDAASAAASSGQHVSGYTASASGYPVTGYSADVMDSVLGTDSDARPSDARSSAATALAVAATATTTASVHDAIAPAEPGTATATDAGTGTGTPTPVERRRQLLSQPSSPAVQVEPPTPMRCTDELGASQTVTGHPRHPHVGSSRFGPAGSGAPAAAASTAAGLGGEIGAGVGGGSARPQASASMRAMAVVVPPGGNAGSAAGSVIDDADHPAAGRFLHEVPQTSSERAAGSGAVGSTAAASAAASAFGRSRSGLAAVAGARAAQDALAAAALEADPGVVLPPAGLIAMPSPHLGTRISLFSKGGSSTLAPVTGGWCEPAPSDATDGACAGASGMASGSGGGTSSASLLRRPPSRQATSLSNLPFASAHTLPGDSVLPVRNAEGRGASVSAAGSQPIAVTGIASASVPGQLVRAGSGHVHSGGGGGSGSAGIGMSFAHRLAKQVSRGVLTVTGGGGGVSGGPGTAGSAGGAGGNSDHQHRSSNSGNAGAAAAAAVAMTRINSGKNAVLPLPLPPMGPLPVPPRLALDVELAGPFTALAAAAAAASAEASPAGAASPMHAGADSHAAAQSPTHAPSPSGRLACSSVRLSLGLLAPNAAAADVLSPLSVCQDSPRSLAVAIAVGAASSPRGGAASLRRSRFESDSALPVLVEHERSGNGGAMEPVLQDICLACGLPGDLDSAAAAAGASSVEQVVHISVNPLYVAGQTPDSLAAAAAAAADVARLQRAARAGSGAAGALSPLRRQAVSDMGMAMKGAGAQRHSDSGRWGFEPRQQAGAGTRADQKSKAWGDRRRATLAHISYVPQGDSADDADDESGSLQPSGSAVADRAEGSFRRDWKSRVAAGAAAASSGAPMQPAGQLLLKRPSRRQRQPYDSKHVVLAVHGVVAGAIGGEPDASATPHTDSAVQVFRISSDVLPVPQLQSQQQPLMVGGPPGLASDGSYFAYRGAATLPCLPPLLHSCPPQVGGMRGPRPDTQGACWQDNTSCGQALPSAAESAGMGSRDAAAGATSDTVTVLSVLPPPLQQLGSPGGSALASPGGGNSGALGCKPPVPTRMATQTGALAASCGTLGSGGGPALLPPEHRRSGAGAGAARAPPPLPQLLQHQQLPLHKAKDLAVTAATETATASMGAGATVVVRHPPPPHHQMQHRYGTLVDEETDSGAVLPYWPSATGEYGAIVGSYDEGVVSGGSLGLGAAGAQAVRADAVAGEGQGKPPAPALYPGAARAAAAAPPPTYDRVSQLRGAEAAGASAGYSGYTSDASGSVSDWYVPPQHRPLRTLRAPGRGSGGDGGGAADECGQGTGGADAGGAGAGFDGCSSSGSSSGGGDELASHHARRLLAEELLRVRTSGAVLPGVTLETLRAEAEAYSPRPRHSPTSQRGHGPHHRQGHRHRHRHAPVQDAELQEQRRQQLEKPQHWQSAAGVQDQEAGPAGPHNLMPASAVPAASAFAAPTARAAVHSAPRSNQLAHSYPVVQGAQGAGHVPPVGASRLGRPATAAALMGEPAPAGQHDYHGDLGPSSMQHQVAKPHHPQLQPAQQQQPPPPPQQLQTPRQQWQSQQQRQQHQHQQQPQQPQQLQKTTHLQLQKSRSVGPTFDTTALGAAVESIDRADVAPPPESSRRLRKAPTMAAYHRLPAAPASGLPLTAAMLHASAEALLQHLAPAQAIAAAAAAAGGGKAAAGAAAAGATLELEAAEEARLPMGAPRDALERWLVDHSLRLAAERNVGPLDPLDELPPPVTAAAPPLQLHQAPQQQLQLQHRAAGMAAAGVGAAGARRVSASGNTGGAVRPAAWVSESGSGVAVDALPAQAPAAVTTGAAAGVAAVAEPAPMAMPIHPRFAHRANRGARLVPEPEVLQQWLHRGGPAGGASSVQQH
ncbi:hypothetical protein HYH02_004709 [Chlamydomonas schloesseri]|uniref:Uncharacterized protein n=1 Tax=Chlamydomonas schloesseri TaxID=2026947 RepID=A0A836B8G4_9CHLO|nr:hypothetical protein HYH02_004709 [Chlamydomonas schloesseri]|eukprot:KAG2450876.1 hypothetical protein HYH02_004709 [Chlamydomonas schloesseri]